MENGRKITAGAAKLRGKARRAVDLHHLEGLSYREAAARLDLSINGVKALLSRARRALRECVSRRLASQSGELES